MGIESNYDSLVHHNAKSVTHWGLGLALRKDDYNDFMKTKFGTTMLKEAVFQKKQLVPAARAGEIDAWSGLGKRDVREASLHLDVSTPVVSLLSKEG